MERTDVKKQKKQKTNAQRLTKTTGKFSGRGGGGGGGNQVNPLQNNNKTATALGRKTNNSPEIPGRRVTSDILAFLLEANLAKSKNVYDFHG